MLPGSSTSRKLPLFRNAESLSAPSRKEQPGHCLLKLCIGKNQVIRCVSQCRGYHSAYCGTVSKAILFHRPVFFELLLVIRSNRMKCVHLLKCN